MKTLLKNFILVSAVALTYSLAASDEAVRKAKEYAEKVKIFNDAITQLAGLDTTGTLATDARSPELVRQAELAWNVIRSNLATLEAFKNRVTGPKAGQTGVTDRTAFQKAIGKNIAKWLEDAGAARTAQVATWGWANEDYGVALEYYLHALATKAQGELRTNLGIIKDWKEAYDALQDQLKQVQADLKQAQQDVRDYKDVLIAIDGYVNTAGHADPVGEVRATIQLLKDENPPKL